MASVKKAETKAQSQGRVIRVAGKAPNKPSKRRVLRVVRNAANKPTSVTLAAIKSAVLGVSQVRVSPKKGKEPALHLTLKGK